MWDDGDPLDILVMVDESLSVGVLLEVRPIGLLKMRDEKGSDYKVLGVAVNDPRYSSFHDVTDIPKHVLVEIEHFFETYKALENKHVKTRGWSHAVAARKAILRAMSQYVEHAEAD